MGKKSKTGKSRLDKFYRIAKESGLRSRAAFKLIQLNRKYNFLQTSNVLVDLCAAPGGWLQVAEKYMPMNSIKIGVDLDPIKAIPHCKTFVTDITTEQCRQLIKKEVKGQKVDVVLHDGAPNVGANWGKDAFTQSELVLSSFKLACQLLRKGGTFVTKVFRSGDYNSLIWLFGKFFQKVEATKPEASRMVSAEIFVVCQSYLCPDYIDDKFFDMKYVFKDTENDLNLQSYLENEITSVDKILTKRRHRDGYADDAPQHLYRVCTFDKFINCTNPFPLFMEYNKIDFNTQDQEKYLQMKIKLPEDYQILLDDIKLLGRREITALLKWRQRILNENTKQQQKEKKQEIQIEKENKIEEVVNSEDELEQDILNNEKLNLKALRKERSKKINQMQKQKGRSGGDIEEQMNSVPLENSDELFSLRAHKNLQKIGYIDVDEQELEENNKRILKEQNKLKKYQFVNENDIEQNVEHLYALKQKRKNVMKDKQTEALLKKRKIKNDNKKVTIDEDKLAIGDNALDNDQNQKYDKRNNGGIEVIPNPQAEEDQKNEESNQNVQQKMQSKWFDREVFNDLKLEINNKNQSNKIKPTTFQKGENIQDEEDSDGDIDDSSDDDEEQYKNNNKISNKSKSINKKSNKTITQNKFDDDEDDDNDDDDNEQEDDQSDKSDWDDEGAERYVPKVPLTDMEKRRKKLARSRKRDDRKTAAKSKDENIQFVDDKNKLENYNIEDLAVNLSLAKKMLRKKDREAIIESSYSRYAIDEDDEKNLPSWFLDEEKQYNYLSLPVTKEEVAQQKEQLYAINQRQPKKILEAKNRNKRRLYQKLTKAKKKAEQVYEQEGMTEKTKVRTIHNLFKKARDSSKQNKKYVVGSKGKNPSGKVNARGQKNVDSRMKKERRAKRRIDKRDGPKMSKGSKNIQKPKKAKKVHTSRRNR